IDTCRSSSVSNAGHADNGRDPNETPTPLTSSLTATAPSSLQSPTHKSRKPARAGLDAPPASSSAKAAPQTIRSGQVVPVQNRCGAESAKRLAQPLIDADRTVRVESESKSCAITVRPPARSERIVWREHTSCGAGDTIEIKSS